MIFKPRRPKVGTPENPEIIEPGQSRPMNSQSHRGHRLARSLQILTWMIAAALPAATLDSSCLWLWEIANQQHSVMAWMLLILLSPVAVLATLIGGIIVCALGLLFLANLFGRTTIRLARF